MWCPSCIYFYDEVQQFQMPFPFRQTAEFLLEQLPRLTFTREVRPAGRPALPRAERRRAAARARRAAQLLEAVPGLTVVPVEPEPRLGRLCTADVQQQLGKAVWDGLVRDEIARAHAGGADTLATIYHGCQRLLCGFEAEAPLGGRALPLGLRARARHRLRGHLQALAALRRSRGHHGRGHAVHGGQRRRPAAARALVERTFVPLPRRAPAADAAQPS